MNSMTSEAATATLITIPLSHYCEKARWALDRTALPYLEAAHAPLFHFLATKRHAGGSVPVLVHGANSFIDSTEILMHADALCGGGLYPRDPALRREVVALEELFDTKLGPHVRRWAYAHLLPQPRLLRSIWSSGVPRFEANVLAIVAPLVRRLVRSAYGVTPQGGQRSLERIHEVFREVEQILSHAKRFLVGDRFSAADLTFAALAAPLLLPSECRAAHPALEVVPAAMREEILRLRATEAGKFALRLFSEERG
jgi:glutathione S-transferase